MQTGGCYSIKEISYYPSSKWQLTVEPTCVSLYLLSSLLLHLNHSILNVYLSIVPTGPEMLQGHGFCLQKLSNAKEMMRVFLWKTVMNLSHGLLAVAKKYVW